jgi:MFS family permease
MTHDTIEPTAPETPPATASWAPLAVLMSGIFMFVLDFFVVNVALPSIQSSLHASTGTIEWVVAGYAVTTAALLVTGARLGDRLGARAVFAAGLGLFTAASMGCALAPTAGALVVARLGQGLAAAVMAPNVLSILGQIYDGERRIRAISVYGMVMGVAAVSGQLIGGALIGAGLGWRAIFWVNVPIGLVGLLLVRLIPAIPASRSRRFDLVGVVLLSAGLVAVVLPLVDGRAQGWPTWSWTCLALAPVILAVFAAYQSRLARRGRAPLLDPAILLQPGLAAGLLTQITFWCQQAASYLFLALYLQSGRGLSPIASGGVFTVLVAGYLVTSAKAPALTQRHGRAVLLVGALVAAVGDLALGLGAQAGADRSMVLLFPGLFLLGAGQGLCITPLTTTVLAYAGPTTAGAVSGALSTMQQVGNAIGVAVVGLVFFGALDDGYTAAFTRSVLAMAVLLVGVAVLTRLMPRPAEALDTPAGGDSTMEPWTSGSRSATSRG